MINVTYIWEKDNQRVRGVINFLNEKQFTEDELKMSIEMMKAGWSFVRKEVK